MNNQVGTFDSKKNLITFTFNEQPGAVFFNTMNYICDGVSPTYGPLSGVGEGSDFYNFLNQEVLLCANLA
jgi:hypothetical protein